MTRTDKLKKVVANLNLPLITNTMITTMLITNKNDIEELSSVDWNEKINSIITVIEKFKEE